MARQVLREFCSSSSPTSLVQQFSPAKTANTRGQENEGEGVERAKAGPGLLAAVPQCRINMLKDLTFTFPRLLAPVRTRRNKRRCQSTTTPMSPVKEQCLSTFLPEHMWRLKEHKTKRMECRRRKGRQSTNQGWFRK